MAAVDTGGVQIEHWGGFQAHVPGLDTAMRLGSRTPEWRELGQQYRMGKDFNDQPFAPTVGSIGGQQALDVTGLTAL